MEQVKLERLARAFALSLADPSFRAWVIRGLATSVNPEGKVDVRRLLESDAAYGLRALAATAARTPESFATEVGLSIPRDLYLPFAPHRAAWAGNRDILVATAARDGDAPIAFDLSGRRIVLDPKVPPSMPVIAVLPSESLPGALEPRSGPHLQEACPPGEEDLCGGSGGGGSPPPPPPPPADPCAVTPIGWRLIVCESNITDVSDYEGWLRGSPEVSIMVFSVLRDGTGEMRIGCASEDGIGLARFNQDQDQWFGAAQIGDSASIVRAGPAGRKVAAIVWEDDSGSKCEFRSTDPDIDQVLRYLSVGGYLIGMSWFNCEQCPSAGTVLGGWILSGITSWLNSNGDDFIGVAAIPTGGVPSAMQWKIVGKERIAGTLRAVTRR